MSIIASLLALSMLSGGSGAHPSAAEQTVASAAADKEQEAAARAWLALVDRSDWEASFAASGKAFRAPNTVAGWQAASEHARVPLGRVVRREAIAFEHINAPPNGYRLVQFESDFEQRTGVVESVTLEREGGEWRVVGYFIA